MDMKEKYETLSLAVLKDVAKARGLKGTSALKKSDLIERLLEEDRKTQKTEETEPVRENRHDHEHVQREDVRGEKGAGLELSDLDSGMTLIWKNRCHVFKVFPIHCNRRWKSVDLRNK